MFAVCFPSVIARATRQYEIVLPSFVGEFFHFEVAAHRAILNTTPAYRPSSARWS